MGAFDTLMTGLQIVTMTVLLLAIFGTVVRSLKMKSPINIEAVEYNEDGSMTIICEMNGNAGALCREDITVTQGAAILLDTWEGDGHVAVIINADTVLEWRYGDHRLVVEGNQLIRQHHR